MTANTRVHRAMRRTRRLVVAGVTLVVVTAAGIVGAQPASAATCRAHVAIKSPANLKFVSVELGSGYTGTIYAMLRARADVIGPWEKFTFCNYGSYFSLQSEANGLYVHAETSYSDSNNGMLRASSSFVGINERFIEMDTTFPVFGMINSANTLYVSAELGLTGGWYGMLRARAAERHAWETFVWD